MSRTPTKWILLLSVLMVLAFAKTGFADLSGSELVELMRGSENAQAHENGGSWLEAGEYLGYILGVKEGTDDIASALKQTRVFDIPDGATKEQIVAVVSKYLKGHPEKWSEFAAILVIKALMEAFPLKQPAK